MLDGFRQTCRLFHKVFIVTALASLYDRFATHLTPAFFRSMVHCPPRPSHGLRPKRPWSGSVHCNRRAYVVNAALHSQGQVAAASHASFIFVPLFVGPTLDIWGRKPVLLLAMVCSLLSVGTFWGAASATEGHEGLGAQAGWLLPGGAIAGLALAFEPASLALLADLAKDGEHDRSATLSCLMVITHFSHLVGIALSSLVISRGLGSYTEVWAGVAVFMTLLIAAAAALLPESLPRLLPAGSVEESLHPRDVAGSVPQAQGRGRWQFFKVIRQAGRCLRGDAFLCHFLLGRFFVVVGANVAHSIINPYLVGHLGYSQSVAAAGALVAPLSMMAGSALAWQLEPLLGSHRIYGAANVIIAAGFALCGCSAPASFCSSSLFWLGLAVACLGSGLGDPASYVISSCRAAPETRGVIFTLQSCLGQLGGILGALWASQTLFDARAEGWTAATCFFIAALALLLGATWYAVAYFFLARSSNTSGAEDNGTECSERS